MNTVTYDQRDEGWEPYDEQQDAERLPRRPRRQLFNKRSAALAAVIAARPASTPECGSRRGS